MRSASLHAYMIILANTKCM